MKTNKWRKSSMVVAPDQNPLFRRVIFPWYDTDVACVLTGVFMLMVFGFAHTGVSVAFEMSEGGRYVWVPATLQVLSAVGIVTVVLRLYRRHAHKFRKEMP
jgi:TctA family transporter